MTDTSRTSAVWGQRWLEALEQDPRYGLAALSVGERVARAHAEPDVHIRPGVAEVTVTAGPRRRYNTSLFTPVFDDAVWDTLLDHVASSPARSAALIGGTLDAAFDDDLRLLGIDLLPTPGEVTTTCDCAGWSSPCKHVVGALVAVADAIDDDPMLLLSLRGRERPDLIAALEARRTEEQGSDGVEELASQAWLQPVRPLPILDLAATAPGETPTWGAPPSTAPFTAEGLEMIGTDLIHRSAEVISKGAPTWLDLDPLSDLARLAFTFPKAKDRRRIAENSGVSARELAARAAAWDLAGSLGVRAHVSPLDTRRISLDAQLRRVDHHGDAKWLRFEKKSGRWLLVAGPVDDPETLLSAESIGA